MLERGWFSPTVVVVEQVVGLDITTRRVCVLKHFLQGKVSKDRDDQVRTHRRRTWTFSSEERVYCDNHPAWLHNELLVVGPTLSKCRGDLLLGLAVILLDKCKVCEIDVLASDDLELFLDILVRGMGGRQDCSEASKLWFHSYHRYSRT